ncbi:MAG: HAD family hydrolase, partial [Gammaproteobacteria bacterium]|nr:HAD family hydrolase [Gammaproteobacteria bacterium]
AGAVVDGVLAAPHHADGVGPYKVADHPMRKPNPGMFLDAIAHFAADAANSIVIGDRASDLDAGRAAGLRRGILVRTGYGCAEEQSVRALRSADFSIEVIENLDGFPGEWLARGAQ